MSETEAIILETLKSEGHLEFHDLSEDEADALNALVLRGWVDRETRHRDNNVFYPYAVYSITDAGRLALADYKQQMANDAAQHRAEEEERRRIGTSEKRHNWMVAIIGGAIAAFFGGLFLYLCQWLNALH